ncbi:MAG: hypothetical protein H6Q41_4887 [Deltaproteobacteria bacterium]|jgi:hypothetical protein|nr:hypothetical protein [Deltaproteobacteria bacterium]
MKRMIFPGCIVLVLVSLAFVSYGEMQKIAISKGNLADLKGKWTGSRSPKPGTTLSTDLEISKESLPVHAKLIFYNVKKRGKSDTEIHELKGGKINDKGNLLFEGRASLKLELSLYKEGDRMKLEGQYFSSERGGPISLEKK